MKDALAPKSGDRALGLWALALCLPPAVIPAFNHDLFWHLSSARWIWLHASLPTRDFLSWTKPGAPWLDFEWLWDILSAACYQQAGMAGLIGLKFLLIVANLWALLRLLRCKDIQAPWLGAAAVLWSAQMLPRCSPQPDMISLLCFTLTLTLLESRLQKPRWRDMGLVVLLFAIWSQTHAAFVMGLALFPCYALADAWAHQSQAAAAKLCAATAAILGSLCNPYGTGPYKVLIWHWQESSAMTRFVREWTPMSARDPFYWPFWAALAILAALAVWTIFRARSRKISWDKIPLGAALATAALAFLSLRHARFSSYFNAPACLVIAALAQNAFAGRQVQVRKSIALFFAAYSAFLLYFLPRINWSLTLINTDLPQAAAGFMELEQARIEPLKLYHPWEWGGYLGWRLRPWFKIFGDGRYIFHEQHERAEDAFGSPKEWQDYLEQKGADGALLPNVDIMINSQRRYPNGTLKAFKRPWFIFYMPRSRWALVYWDSRAMLFVERSAVSATWLAAHEYRYLHPKDAAAFNDALHRGEIDHVELKREQLQHQEEMREYSP